MSQLLIDFRAAAHLSDTTVLHTHNSAQMTAGGWCKWILTHNLALTIPALSHHRSDHLGCNTHGGVYSTRFIHGGAYSRQFVTFNTGPFISPLLNQGVPCSPSFGQKSAAAVFCTVIGCDSDTSCLESDQSCLFHMHCLQLCHSQVMPCGMALNPHMEQFHKILLIGCCVP